MNLKSKILRNICTLTAGTIILSMFTACGKNNSEEKRTEKLLDKDSPITITIWHYYNGVQQTKFDEMVMDFNNTLGAEKGIIIEANTKNGVDELANNVVDAANGEPGADQLPDIFACYADTAYNLDKKGIIADLKPYFTDEELAEYVPSYIEEGIFSEDSLKIFPTAKSSEVLIINETDWNKFADSEGLSYDDLKTWESLAKVAEKYYNYTDALTPDVEGDGKAFFGRDALANYFTVGATQLFGEMVNSQDKDNPVLNLDKDTVKKLWDNYYVPYLKGYYTAESLYRSDDEKIGTIIALIGSTTGSAYCANEVTIDDEYTYPIENKVLPVPNFEGYEQDKSYVIQQGAGMSVIKSDKKTEYACSIFLKWFTETERNVDFATQSGYLPVKKEANNFEKINKIMQHKGITIDPIISDTLNVAIDEINNRTLYCSTPFKNSPQFRTALTNYVSNTADENRDTMIERVENGEDKQKIIEEYTNDKAFDEWFEGLTQQLEQAIN